MSEALDTADAPRPRMIPLANLHESPFNKRRTWGKLDELAKSFEGVGILEPLLGRPHPKKPHDVELVFGHRRLRAAHIAKLATAPIVVKQLTDEQVVEIQCIENLQREDVHPLDEAEGYEQLLKIGKYSADELAVKVGKSRSYIFGRLKLLGLTEKAKKAFSDDKITASVALYVARLPPKLQGELLEEVLPQWKDAEPMSARRVFEIVQRQYMLRLAEAPFDIADVTLVPKAGACGSCPHRTGNQPELFSDVPSADVCTNKPCFDAKRQAHGRRLVEKARDKGARVLEGTAATKAINEANGYRGKLVDIDRPFYGDHQHRKPRAILKGLSPEKKTLVLDEQGNVHELVERTQVESAVRSAKNASKASSASTGLSEQEKKRRELRARERVKTNAVLGAVIAAAEKTTNVEKGLWKFLAARLAHQAGHDLTKEVLARRGVDTKPKGEHDRYRDFGAVLRKLAREMTDAQAKGLVVELATAGNYSVAQGETGAAAALFKVDAKKVSAAAIAEAKKTKASPKKTAKKGGAS